MELEQQPVEGHRAVGSMRPGAVVAGLILLALGVSMLLDTTGILQVNAGRLVAPFILIAIGAAIVLDKGAFTAGYRSRDAEGRPRMRRRRGGGIGGLWLIGVGTWMLVSQSHLFGMTFHTSWPLLMVLAGVMMVIRGMR